MRNFAVLLATKEARKNTEAASEAVAYVRLALRAWTIFMVDALASEGGGTAAVTSEAAGMAGRGRSFSTAHASESINDFFLDQERFRAVGGDGFDQLAMHDRVLVVHHWQAPAS